MVRPSIALSIVAGVAGLAGLAGCSSSGGSTTPGTGDPVFVIGGSYCGKVVTSASACTGDEVGYLVILQGATITGKACEAYEKECYDLQGATLAGTKLTFFYTFGADRVDCDLTASNRKLDGTCRSTKAPGMIIPKTYTRFD